MDSKIWTMTGPQNFGHHNLEAKRGGKFTEKLAGVRRLSVTGVLVGRRRGVACNRQWRRRGAPVQPGPRGVNGLHRCRDLGSPATPPTICCYAASDSEERASWRTILRQHLKHRRLPSSFALDSECAATIKRQPHRVAKSTGEAHVGGPTLIMWTISDSGLKTSV